MGQRVGVDSSCASMRCIHRAFYVFKFPQVREIFLRHRNPTDHVGVTVSHNVLHHKLLG